MPTFEDNRNFPTVLGKKNVRREISWGAGRRVANLPAVRELGGGPLLPAIGRPSDMSVVTDQEQTLHNAVAAQLTNYPIVPLFNRPSPMLARIKQFIPRLSRAKLYGVFGIFGQRNIPLGDVGTRVTEWKTNRRVADLPKVLNIFSGPENPLHPQRRDLSLEM